MTELTQVDFTIEDETLDFKLSGEYVVGGSADLPINYEKDSELTNRPSINGTELIGNKTSKQLKLQDEMNALSVTDIEKILYLG